MGGGHAMEACQGGDVVRRDRVRVRVRARVRVRVRASVRVRVRARASVRVWAGCREGDTHGD